MDTSITARLTIKHLNMPQVPYMAETLWVLLAAEIISPFCYYLPWLCSTFTKKAIFYHQWPVL
jgi:hypothetical protein